MVLISQTYENWDKESLDAGETDDRGYDSENVEYDFHDLVSELKRYWIHGELSDRHNPSNRTWITRYSDDSRTGEHKVESLHFSSPEPRKEKYWTKALRAAKIYKGE